MINRNEIKVTIKLLDNQSILAQAKVIFPGNVETHGWRVMRSKYAHPVFQDSIWIQPPSYKIGNKWRPLVYVADKKLYDQIEEMIYDAYHQALTKERGEEGVIKYEESLQEDKGYTVEGGDDDTIPF